MVIERYPSVLAATLAGLLLLAMPVAYQRGPQQASLEEHGDCIRRIDHIVVFCDSAEGVDSMMQAFTKGFGLPKFWGPERYDMLIGEVRKAAGFYSGGVFLGNATLEFETWEGDAIAARPAVDLGFAGVAFEPADAGRAIACLGEAGLEPGPAEPWFSSGPEGGAHKMWTLIDLPRLNSAALKLFLCAYEPVPVEADGDWVMMTHEEMRGLLSAQLEAGGGGALGVVRMKQLTLGVADLPRRLAEYAALLGEPAGDALWKLGDSQTLRLVEAEADAIQSVTLEVALLESAREFLLSKSMLGGESSGRIEIAPAAIGGLRIYLEQAGN